MEAAIAGRKARPRTLDSRAGQLGASYVSWTITTKCIESETT